MEAAVITSVPQAMRTMKALGDESLFCDAIFLHESRQAGREAMKNDLRKIMNAPNRTKARSAARIFAKNWEKHYPKAVACLAGDMDALLIHYHFKTEKWRKAARSTNAIERCFVEVRRRTRPMGVMAGRASMSRIL